MTDVKVTEIGSLSDEMLAALALLACEEITFRICPDEPNRAATMRAIRSILAIEDLRHTSAPEAGEMEEGT